MKATYARDNDHEKYHEYMEKKLDKKFSKGSKSKALESKKGKDVDKKYEAARSLSNPYK